MLNMVQQWQDADKQVGCVCLVDKCC